MGRARSHFWLSLPNSYGKVWRWLIHAKEPGPNFREDFDKYPVLYDRLERVLCPRVHFKMLVFDGKEVYVGSANLTGAGIGMKTDNKRNFEAGILTDNTEIVEQAMNQFDEVWMGKQCKSCKRRDYCSDPIAWFIVNKSIILRPLPPVGGGLCLLCAIMLTYIFVAGLM